MADILAPDDDEPKKPVRPARDAGRAPFAFDFNMPLMTPAEAARLGIPFATAQAVANALRGWLGNIQASAEEAARQLPHPDFIPDNAPPEPLPVPVSNAVMDGYLAGIKWNQIRNLPGYRDPRIRTIGSAVFNSFPCYRAFAERMKAEGKDAHGEVRVMSFFTHDQTSVATMARLILQHGQEIEKGTNDYGTAIPGYNPQLALYMTENWTFKLVKESPATGAPVDMVSIYAWPGGRRFYSQKINEAAPPAALPGQQLG